MSEGLRRAAADAASNEVERRLRDARAVDARVAMLEPRAATLATRVSAPHRRYAEALIAGDFGEEEQRLFDRALRTLACITDVVASWPGDAELDPSRVQLSYHTVDLAELVRVCCDAFGALARERRIEYRADVPELVRADVDVEKIEKVVLNLLLNAFKVTPAGGAITFQVRVEGDEARLTVADGGPGVPQGTEQEIFSRFRSARRPSALVADWLGFELASARDFMRLHGGDLWLAASASETGAVFCARIPLQAPPFASVRSEHFELTPALALRVARIAAEELHVEERLGEFEAVGDHRSLVLVVEDSRLTRRILVETLSEHYSVASAADGGAGLELARQMQPDLIITDLVLPGLDGRALIRAIRATSGLGDTPILVVSGTDDDALTVELLRDGVHDVMHKPFLMPELLARAHNLLDARRARLVLGELIGERDRDLSRLADDVTHHQRRLEAALAELRVARELAESASRIKSNFLRMMSHELKTPVTALMLQQQILAEEELIRGTPRIAKGFRSISRSVSRLLHIVDSVLEWARVESGRCRVVRREISLRDVAEAALAECRHIAAGKGLVLALDDAGEPHLAFDDAALIRLILINLIERAIAASDSGVVMVRLSQEARWHRLRVIDRGRPTNEEERRQLLDPFMPGVDLYRGGSGSGLGLCIVRDLARALDGEVVMSEEDSEGNTVELRLPRRGAPRSDHRAGGP